MFGDFKLNGIEFGTALSSEHQQLVSRDLAEEADECGLTSILIRRSHERKERFLRQVIRFGRISAQVAQILPNLLLMVADQRFEVGLHDCFDCIHTAEVRPKRQRVQKTLKSRDVELPIVRIRISTDKASSIEIDPNVKAVLNARNYMNVQNAAVLFLLVGCSISMAQIRHVESLHREVEGGWTSDVGAVGFQISPETYGFDADGDGISDIQLQHGFELNPLGLRRTAVSLLNVAEDGVTSAVATLHALRTDLEEADSQTVVGRRRIREHVNAGVDALQLIADTTAFGAVINFTHEPGVWAYATQPDHVEVVGTTANTQRGTYPIEVTTAAERATVTAGTSQFSGLAWDETLMINGISIDLEQGMTSANVIDRINSRSADTGVFADMAPDFATRLYTSDLGSRAVVSVMSNISAASDSSGFGFSEFVDVGSDAVVEIDGYAYSGRGGVVTIPAGPANGLSFGVLPGEVDPTISAVGPIGAIEVVADPFDPRVELAAANASPEYVGRVLLDGSETKQAMAIDNDVVSIRLSEDTLPGSYAIDVATAAERATVEASVRQTSALQHDELLVVNGFDIQLEARMTQGQIIDRINEHSEITGVLADVGSSGGTRLYSSRFGSDATLSVVPDTAAAADSSGFGVQSFGIGATRFRELTDIGRDAIVEIGGVAYTGSGNIVRAMGGPQKGLQIAIEPDAADPSTTVLGAQGTVVVLDNTPEFRVGLNSSELQKIPLPDVSPSLFQLDRVEIVDEEDVHTALSLVNSAIEDLEIELANLRNSLEAVGLPSGVSDVVGVEGVQFVAEDGFLIKLTSNDVIGSHSPFEETGIIDASGLYPNSWDTGEGFLGFAVPSGDDYLFGWARIDVAENASFTIMDYALETTPNRVIWIGGPLDEANSEMIPSLAADLDGDGEVGVEDFLLLSRNFGVPDPTSGDIDGNGEVDVRDFLVLSREFGALEHSVVVPEPRTTWMLLLATILFLRRRHPRQKVDRLRS